MKKSRDKFMEDLQDRVLTLSSNFLNHLQYQGFSEFSIFIE